MTHGSEASAGSSTSGPPNEVPIGLSHLAHRQSIGYLGFLLPFVLFGLAAARPTPGLPRFQTLTSISAYYYTGAVAAFLGILFALSLFLFTYRGYSESKADWILGIVGGFCALGVAFFPTTAPGGLAPPDWWTTTYRTIHYVSAASLFGVFILFSVWLFRKSDSKPEDRPPDKKLRNHVYLGCGIVMIAAILWAAWSGSRGGSIFWPEAVALWAFAVSWLVKGEAHARWVR